MGSSTNGITRGQLRPHFSGRSPPFIICGLFIALIIISYCYWNLSFRFNILQKNMLVVEERLRTSANKNEILIKQNEGLNDKLHMNLEIINQNKNSVAKKEEELNQLSSQLRHKEEEINRLNSQIEALKTDADKCKETLDSIKIELSTTKAKIKELETENTNFKEKISTMEHNLSETNNEKKSNAKNPVQSLGTQNQAQVKTTSNEGNQNDKTEPKNEDPDISQPANI